MSAGSCARAISGNAANMISTASHKLFLITINSTKWLRACYEPRSGSDLQPNVAALRLRWDNRKIEYTNRDAVASLPKVTFIPFNAMPPQQRAQFILKVDFAVMLFLICDIS